MKVPTKIKKIATDAARSTSIEVEAAPPKLPIVRVLFNPLLLPRHVRDAEKGRYR